MCLDPITAIVAGTVLTAGAQVASGIAQGQVYDRQAGIERQRAGYEADRAQEDAKRLLGRSIASAGSSGLTIDSFTAPILDNATEMALDEAAIRYGGEARATSLEASASSARFGGFLGAAGTVGSAVASAAPRMNSTRLSGSFR